MIMIIIIRITIIIATQEIGSMIDFEEGKVILEGETLNKSWKETWKSVKRDIKAGIET